MAGRPCGNWSALCGRLLGLLLLLSGRVQQAHGIDPISAGITAASLVIYALEDCLFPQACRCRQYYLLLQSKQQTSNKVGPRFVFGESQFSWGGQCQLGNTPIAPGATGGIMVGNNGGTILVGVNGFSNYMIYSDNGRVYLNCMAVFDFVNPYWRGIADDTRASLRLVGPGCSLPPIVGKADFQENFNLKLNMVQEEKGDAAKILYEAYYEDSQPSISASEQSNLLIDQSAQICTNSTNNTYYDIPGPQLETLDFVDGHSYISSEEAGRQSNPNYDGEKCSVASTTITQACVSATTYFGANVTEVRNFCALTVHMSILRVDIFLEMLERLSGGILWC